MTIQELCEKNNCYKVTPEGSINTRCPYCGDSQKAGHTVNYGQAYIFKDGYFKCFRCGKYATATDAIQQIATNVRVPLSEIDQVLKDFKVTAVKYIMESDNKFTYYENTEETLIKYQFKLKYLKERLFVDDITPELLNKYKIVIDLDPYYEQLIQKFKYLKPNDYVGFMTRDNYQIVFRAINNNTKYRYFNLKINQAYDYWTTQDFDDNFFKTKTVYLGEGIFDVANSRTQELFSNGCHIAVLSKNNILAAVKKIFSLYLLKFNLVILKDRDVSISYIRFLKKLLKPYVSKVEVYGNLSGKDFGDKNLTIEKFSI